MRNLFSEISLFIFFSVILVQKNDEQIVFTGNFGYTLIVWHVQTQHATSLPNKNPEEHFFKWGTYFQSIPKSRTELSNLLIELETKICKENPSLTMQHQNTQAFFIETFMPYFFEQIIKNQQCLQSVILNKVDQTGIILIQDLFC